MLDAFISVAEVFGRRRKADPHWISFIGASETGKTHLARALFKAWNKWGRLVDHPSGATTSRSGAFVQWGEACDDFRTGNWTRVTSLCELDFLVLDDIGTEHDPSGCCKAALTRILDARLGKWTVITSNLSSAEIGDAIDYRIMSRMSRGLNRVVEAKHQNWSLRV